MCSLSIFLKAPRRALMSEDFFMKTINILFFMRVSNSSSVRGTIRHSRPTEVCLNSVKRIFFDTYTYGHIKFIAFNLNVIFTEAFT